MSDDDSDKKVLYLYDIVCEAAEIAADALNSEQLTFEVAAKANKVLEHYFDWVINTAGIEGDE